MPPLCIGCTAVSSNFSSLAPSVTPRDNYSVRSMANTGSAGFLEFVAGFHVDGGRPGIPRRGVLQGRCARFRRKRGEFSDPSVSCAAAVCALTVRLSARLGGCRRVHHGTGHVPERRDAHLLCQGHCEGVQVSFRFG